MQKTSKEGAKLMHSTKSGRTNSTYLLTSYGLMTALAFVSNYIRFPLLGSQVTVSNSICVLCGMILGPWAGFVTAGIGAFLYDLIAGYGIEGLITLVSKGAIGMVAGIVCHHSLKKAQLTKKDSFRMFAGAALAALTYVVLYMLKTFVMGLTVKGLTMEATLVSMGSKLPASLINAVFATVAAPLLMTAVHYPLWRQGILKE